MRIQDIVNFETFVTNVSFNDDSIEVTFLEKREQAEDVMMARTMVAAVKDEDGMQMYADLQGILRDFIENGYISLRNPPEEFEDKPAVEKWVHQQMTGSNGD